MKYNLYNSDSRQLILCILQITTLYNAVRDGWDVKHLGERRFELSKKFDNILDFNTDFLDRSVNCMNYKVEVEIIN